MVGANLTLAGESELGKLLTDIVKKKKALIGAERELRDVEAEVKEIKDAIHRPESQSCRIESPN